MHRDLSCLKEKLESVTLHKVVPQAPLQRHPSLIESLLRRWPTYDDMPFYKI
jgi:hypothetical protein